MGTVAHIAQIAPHQTGLYGTARDIVKAERELGLDARLVDPKMPKVGEVHGVPVASHQWACSCPVWVSHSGTNKCLEPEDRPVIHVMHGRPYSSYLLGIQGKTHVYPVLMGWAEKYAAFVTLWEEFLPYWRHLLPAEKLHAAPPPVDLGAWTPDGPSGYRFGGKRGEVNVLITDIWREDKNPHETIHAFSLYAEKNPEARLHLYGLPRNPSRALMSIFAPLKKRGVLGEAKGIVSGLANAYRAADVLITPHRIATRTVREALACGCSVVMSPRVGEQYTPYTCQCADIEGFAQQMDRAIQNRKAKRTDQTAINRASAMRHFDPKRTAEKFAALVAAVTEE